MRFILLLFIVPALAGCVGDAGTQQAPSWQAGTWWTFEDTWATRATNTLGDKNETFEESGQEARNMTVIHPRLPSPYGPIAVVAILEERSGPWIHAIGTDDLRDHFVRWELGACEGADLCAPPARGTIEAPSMGPALLPQVIEVGETWTETLEPRGPAIEITGRVAAAETIEVQAGRFETLRIVIEGTYADPAEVQAMLREDGLTGDASLKVTIIHWYSGEVGFPVRFEVAVEASVEFEEDGERFAAEFVHGGRSELVDHGVAEVPDWEALLEARGTLPVPVVRDPQSDVEVSILEAPGQFNVGDSWTFGAAASPDAEVSWTLRRLGATEHFVGAYQGRAASVTFGEPGRYLLEASASRSGQVEAVDRLMFDVVLLATFEVPCAPGERTVLGPLCAPSELVLPDGAFQVRAVATSGFADTLVPCPTLRLSVDGTEWVARTAWPTLGPSRIDTGLFLESPARLEFRFDPAVSGGAVARIDIEVVPTGTVEIQPSNGC